MNRTRGLLGALSLSAVLAQPACGGTSFNSEDDAGAGNDTSSGGDGATSGKSGSGGSTAGAGGDGSGGTSRGGSAGSSAGRGGVAGTGASAGRAGAAGSSGAAGVAGTGGCGFCPAVACFAPVQLQVSAESSMDGIQDLTAESDDLGLYCFGGSLAPCQWNCQSQNFFIADGHYSIRLSAPGYESQTVEFDYTNPTNCGCCGCGCGPNIQLPVSLKRNGDPVGNCCANVSTDPTHCGDCETSCSGNACIDGECQGIGGTGGMAGAGGASGNSGAGGSSSCSPPVPPESDPDCPEDLAALQAQPCDRSGMECYRIDEGLGADPCTAGFQSTNALCCDQSWQVSWTTYPPGTDWNQPVCGIAEQ